MKIANSLLFAAFALAASSLLLAQGHASPNVFSVSGTTVLSSVDTMATIRPDEVLVLQSDRGDLPIEGAVLSDFYNEAPLNDTGSSSANRGDPPGERADWPSPCGNGPTTNADPGMVIDNYEALLGHGISPTDARQIAEITGETGI
jgi:hypothetical protein